MHDRRGPAVIDHLRHGKRVEPHRGGAGGGEQQDCEGEATDHWVLPSLPSHAALSPVWRRQPPSGMPAQTASVNSIISGEAVLIVECAMSVVAVLGTITQSRVNATASERRPSIVKSSINWSVVDELTAFSK